MPESRPNQRQKRPARPSVESRCNRRSWIAALRSRRRSGCWWDRSHHVVTARSAATRQSRNEQRGRYPEQRGRYPCLRSRTSTGMP